MAKLVLEEMTDSILDYDDGLLSQHNPAMNSIGGNELLKV